MIIPLNYTREPTIRNSNSNSVGCSFPWNFRWRCAVLRIKIAKDFIYMTIIVYWVIQWGTKKPHNKLYLWYIFTPNFLTTYSVPLYFSQWHQLEKKDSHLHSRLWWIQFLVQLFRNLHTSAFCPCVPLLGMASWQPPFHKLKSRKQLCFLQLLFGGFNVTKCCFMVKINSNYSISTRTSNVCSSAWYWTFGWPTPREKKDRSINPTHRNNTKKHLART